MANECKMEFYFKRADIEKLLADNQKAKGVIISYEIVQEKPRGSLKMVNQVYIKARAFPESKKKAATKKSAALIKGPGDPDEATGCPYPPGCTEG